MDPLRHLHEDALDDTWGGMVVAALTVSAMFLVFVALFIYATYLVLGLW